MPWCPNCREEYREGFDYCKDCDCALVETLPPLPDPVPEAQREEYPSDSGWHMSHPKDYTLPGPMEHPALLTATNDPVRLEMLMDMLEQAGIHAFAADDSTARSTRLYMGVSAIDREVYVEQAHLEEAQALLEGYFAQADDLESPQQAEEEPEADHGYPRQASAFSGRRTFVQWIFLLVVGGFFALLALGLLSMLGEVMGTLLW